MFALSQQSLSHLPSSLRQLADAGMSLESRCFQYTV